MGNAMQSKAEIEGEKGKQEILTSKYFSLENVQMHI
jgi:hypothetical protein